MTWRKNHIVIHFSFQNILCQEKPVNHGRTSEDRKQLPLGQWCHARAPCAPCLNLNALQNVCVHFKRPINTAKRLASNNSLQVLSQCTALDRSPQKCQFISASTILGKNCSFVTLLTCFNPHFQHPKRESPFSFAQEGANAVHAIPLCTVHTEGEQKSGVWGYRVRSHKATAGPRSR